MQVLQSNAALILILCLFIINILLLRYILVIKRVIRKLARAYDSVASGQYDGRFDEIMTGDIGKAEQSFRLMMLKTKENIEELKDKNLKLHAILKSISNGIIVMDSKQNIILINKAARDILHCSEDVEGRPLPFHARGRKLRNTILDMVYRQEEKAVQIETDSVWYKIKVDPVRLDEDSGLVIGNIINMEDVTGRVRLEHIRTDFVTNVTHELKTPLTSISGFAETLRDNDDIPAERRMRFLNIIEAESDRLKRLIDDILTLSAIETSNDYLREEWFSPGDLITDCVRLFEHTAESRKVSIEVQIPYALPKIRSNPDLVKQLLINLIDNAVKYSGEKGRVILRAKISGEDLHIAVEDNGIGMSKEELPRIFERFYRVDKARSRKERGTGLGLAIVKHSLIRLGGSIEVESEPGKGSCFQVYLPQSID